MLFIKMYTTNLPSAFYLLLLLLICAIISSCRAQNQTICLPSSCGPLTDIRYPFKLKSDPKDCGSPGFELDCRNNRTIIEFKSKIYHVQTINYHNYTIRLVDPVLEKNSFCLLPNYSNVYDDIPSNYYTFRPGKNISYDIKLNVFVAFMNCLAPVNSPRYINTTLCRDRNTTFASNSSGKYSYVSLGDDITVSEFGQSCNVEKVAWSSVQGPIGTGNTSLTGIYAGLAYGFELSWHRIVCLACDASGGSCTVLETGSDCRHYCYEDTPYDERSFRCKLDYLAPFILGYGGIAIVGTVALRFILGLFFLVGVVVYQRKRRHLSIDEDTEDLPKSRDNQHD